MVLPLTNRVPIVIMHVESAMQRSKWCVGIDVPTLIPSPVE
jgi:hypothetical protein